MNRLFTIPELLNKKSDEELVKKEDATEDDENLDDEDSLEDSEDDEDSDEDEDTATTYNNGNYKVGYYKIKLNNTNSNLFDTISESFYDDDDDDSYMNDDTCEDTCENKDDVFADSQDINDELDELLSAQDGTILNPYSTIEDIADILEDHGFLLHPFNLDPTVDEWVLDIELEDISDEERQVYLHLEIMKENEDIYMIRAGIVPI